MKTFNQKDLEIAARLLRLAANGFSDYGCNDIGKDIWGDWTEEEKQELGDQYHKVNGDYDHLEPSERKISQDWILMTAIANRLDGSIE